MDNVDILVVGSGHNALVAAAYLATAGKRVHVLEAREQPGGNTMTEELTLPGFRHDSCSTAHTLIQSNPLLRDNELHLDRLGLRYLLPDPVFTVSLGEGQTLTMWRDPERTRREIARFSPRDADAYAELLADWRKLRSLQAKERNAPPLSPEDSTALWRSSDLGDEGLRIKLASGLEIIEERFQSPEVRTFIAWVASMTMDAIDHPSTGVLPFALTAGRQEHSWAIPEGGSGSLVGALLQIVRRAGGDVTCHARARRILIENGRAIGVETQEGRQFLASEAVLSSAHIKQLPESIGSSLDRESERYVERWRAGLTMFVTHYALSEAPRYPIHGSEQPSVAMGTLRSIDDLHQILGDFRRGRMHLKHPFLLCLCPTVVDPGRAPEARHTLKVISILPYELAGGSESWDAIKEEVAGSLFDSFLTHTTNLRREHVLALHVESPLDLERRNSNNYHGSCHGGAPLPTQSGWYRPAPAWNGYRTPLPGFYLTGSCTHPGGSVSAFPGRNAARVMFEDLGLSWNNALEYAATTS
jgi:phytoene dehydrogenase-like protein